MLRDELFLEGTEQRTSYKRRNMSEHQEQEEPVKEVLWNFQVGLFQ